MGTILTGCEVPVSVDTPDPHPVGTALMDLTRERDPDTHGWVWTAGNIQDPVVDASIPECADGQAEPFPLHGDLYDTRFDAGTFKACRNCQPQLFAELDGGATE